MSDTMRVKVEIVVEVSKEEWKAAYGPMNSNELRKDVKEYVAYGVVGASDAPITMIRYK